MAPQLQKTPESRGPRRSEKKRKEADQSALQKRNEAEPKRRRAGEEEGAKEDVEKPGTGDTSGGIADTLKLKPGKANHFHRELCNTDLN